MVYILRDKKLGSEDAYGRVFDGEHRDLVKEAFNAMVQSATPLLKEPSIFAAKISLSPNLISSVAVVSFSLMIGIQLNVIKLLIVDIAFKDDFLFSVSAGDNSI